MTRSIVSRRKALTGLGALLAYPALTRGAWADQFIDPFEFGLSGESQDDQSAAMQAAIDAASLRAKDVLLPPGEYYVRDLELRGSMRLFGVPGGTHLVGWGGGPIGRLGSVSDLVLDGMSFSAGEGRPDGENRGLLEFEDSTAVTIRNCMFTGAPICGLSVLRAGATIENCDFIGLGDAAIHSADSRGLMIRGNRISECGNAGVRIWRGESGPDGSIITGNRIAQIDWQGGGNGQTGNGVNVFQADDVIVADNVISGCAFSAIRVNAGNNTQIRGNTCLDSGEVAIFSEFGFSGSVIADNIVDGAATGISITNLDSGGHLATCTGNIVRNITAASAVNPDTRPVGIYAEADTVVANNTIEGVPGIGIVAGYGPYVRNVIVSDNVIIGVETGIGVSVVQEQSPGPVRVSGNIIGKGAAHAIVGMEWENIVSTDLAADAGRYPNVTVSGNTAG
ncbi:MAG: TIGR03808 family TAT-translocated repetitive protein [Devosia nanyangense]|uniref:TIGR03808 family TAT-translocated repetitive protein n=1 Tax=Devosia nanyangense TaxID=1228055 RepID=A0A933NWV0_9HYPH|nr:TIGR03808 family TAT-translocated repetitive protein [Devosia nanyangense]